MVPAELLSALRAVSPLKEIGAYEALLVAMKRILREAFPDTDIAGLFVARRVPETILPEGL